MPHLEHTTYRWDMIARRKVAYILSLALLAGTLFLLATRGLSFGIDFTGGVVMEIQVAPAHDLAPLRGVLNDAVDGEVTLQQFGAPGQWMLRFKQAEEVELVAGESGGIDAIEAVKQVLQAELDGPIDYRRTDQVGPQVGSELIQAGVLALMLSFAAMMAYIWLRFEWQFGLGALLALWHDAILTFGFYSLLGLEFNLTSVAALLTIIGYSINDSVVIYDRIRENLRKYKKMPMTELLNHSVHQTLSRTLLTAGTTLVALLALVLLGGEVLYGFSIAVLFGVVIGTYSSIFIAAPVLLWLPVRPENPAAPKNTDS